MVCGVHEAPPQPAAPRQVSARPPCCSIYVVSGRRGAAPSRPATNLLCPSPARAVQISGNRVVGGSSWLIPLRSDWANEEQFASVELRRCKLHLEFFALRSMPTFWVRPDVPDTTSESRRDGVKIAQSGRAGTSIQGSSERRRRGTKPGLGVRSFSFARPVGPTARRQPSPDLASPWCWLAHCTLCGFP